MHIIDNVWQFMLKYPILSVSVMCIAAIVLSLTVGRYR